MIYLLTHELLPDQTERGALVHAGFNSVFESMKTELSEYINLVELELTKSLLNVC